MAVFLAVVQTVDASPYDFLFAFSRPSASAVRGSAFSADQQFSQSVFAGIFALLGFCANLLDFSFSVAPRQFLLHSAEGAGVNDGGMVILDIVFRAFSVVDLDVLAESVRNVGFVEDGVALVFFVG